MKTPTNAAAENANRVALPFRLGFRDGKRTPKRSGQQDAGWTVFDFDTAADRDAFMARHPGAAMPCWKRIVSGV